MFEGNCIQVGAGRYHQCHGAIQRLGEEVATWGKKAYIVTDETVWGKLEAKASDSLKKAGIEFKVDLFTGPSTQKSFDLVAARGQEFGADVFIGMGGGKCIDIAKGASDVADKRVITVPTSAATCAAWAILYVTYGENGGVEKSQFLRHEISAVIADLDFIGKDCPYRYLASGIADAMAKKPEFIFTLLHLEEGMAANAKLAVTIGDFTWTNYMEKGLKAIEDLKAGKDTPELDDVICLNVMITGMISDLCTGGKQLAVAHNYYDAICCLHPEIRKNYLHGEIVGMAIPWQMAINGASDEEVQQAKALLKAMDVPTTMKEMGVSYDEAVIKEILDYTHHVTIPDDMELYAKMKETMSIVM